MGKNQEDVLLACDLTPGCEGVLHPNVDERAAGFAHFAARCTHCGGVLNYGLYPLAWRQRAESDEDSPGSSPAAPRWEYRDLGGNWRPLPAADG